MKRGKHDSSVIAPPVESPVAGMAGDNRYVIISVLIFCFHISHICLGHNGEGQLEVLPVIKILDASGFH